MIQPWAVTSGGLDVLGQRVWPRCTSLVPFWSFGTPYDVRRRRYLTEVGTPIESTNAEGICGETDANTDYWHLGPADEVLSTTKVTILIVSKKTDATNRAASHFGPVELTSTPHNTRCGANVPWSDGNYYFDYGGLSGANRLTITSPSVSGLLVRVFRAGTLGMSVWQNGARLGNQTTAVTRTDTTANFGINQGAQNVSTTGDLAQYNLFGLFDEEWPDALIQAVSADPFRILRQADDIAMALSVAAAGGASIMNQLQGGNLGADLYDGTLL